MALAGQAAAREQFEELKRLKSRIVIPDAEIIMEAGRINSENPKLGDLFDLKNRADPWVIAAAKLKGFVVVTEEADTGRRKDTQDALGV